MTHLKALQKWFNFLSLWVQICSNKMGLWIMLLKQWGKYCRSTSQIEKGVRIYVMKRMVTMRATYYFSTIDSFSFCYQKIVSTRRSSSVSVQELLYHDWKCCKTSTTGTSCLWATWIKTIQAEIWDLRMKMRSMLKTMNILISMLKNQFS